ncbi:MAG: alpha/beta hydrolase [Parcubacteria group bacterium]|nr:alpha/beta hydrolase [Parcubacteria group bacterium]
MPSIQVQGQPAHYREWGQGSKTLLVLHGWPADSTHYADLGPMLAQADFRVIVPDLPGWGETPQPAAPWSVSDYRRWAHDFAAALSLKDFFLFGHSFGGRVAIKYVLEHPYDVRGLILCAAAGIKPDPFTLRRVVLKSMAAVGKRVFALPVLGKPLRPLAQRLLYRAAGAQDYLQAQGVMKDTIVKVLAEDLTALLPQIKRPTLLLWGSEDSATPLGDGQLMAKQIPLATLHVFAGARHNLPKLVPQGVAEQVIAFASSEHVSFIE